MDWIDTNWADTDNLNNTKRFIIQRTGRYTLYPRWEGQEYAAMADPGRTSIISTVDRRVFDGVHFYGDVATDIGREQARGNIFGPTPLIHTERYWDAILATRAITGVYNFTGTGSGAPSTGNANWEADDSITRINDLFNLFIPGLPLDLIQGPSVVPLFAGDTLTFTQVADPLIYRTFQVSGAPVDQTSYWEYPTTLLSSNGALVASDAVTFTTSRVEELPHDTFLRQGVGDTGLGRVGIGVSTAAEMIGDADFLIKGRKDYGRILGTQTNSGGVEFGLDMSDLLQLCVFNTNGALAFAGQSLYVSFAMKPTDHDSAETSVVIQPSTDKVNVVGLGGAQPGVDGVNIPVGAQVLVGPGLLAVGRATGLVLAGTAGTIDRFGFQDATVGTDYAAFLELDRTTAKPRLTLQNNMGTADSLLEVTTDSVGYWASDVATATGLSIKDIAGGRVEITAALRNAPTVAFYDLYLKATSVRLQDGTGTTVDSLAGTGQRDVEADSTGLLVPGEFPRVKTRYTETTIDGAAKTVVLAFTATAARLCGTLLVKARKTNGTNETYRAKANYVLQEVSGTTSVNYSIYGSAFTGTGSTLTFSLISLSPLFNSHAIQITGNAGEDWSWTVERIEEDI
jgi:hypothetical protein